MNARWEGVSKLLTLLITKVLDGFRTIKPLLKRID